MLLRRLAPPLRAAARRFPRRALASDAERFEGRGPTATEEVNEALGLPRGGGASFVLGGATPASWTALDADVAVHVSRDEALPRDWACATRFTLESPPRLLSAAEDDALPSELADEALFAADPASLTFVLAATHAPEPTFDRLESLFPGSRTMCVVARRVAASGAAAALAGAAFADLSPQSRKMLAAALADLAPFDFRCSASLARDLFLPSEDSRVEPSKPADEDVPCFVLDNGPFAPGEAKTFNIFESRYKLMIKQCVDEARPLLVVGPESDAVGALCRVGGATHDAASGGSTVVLVCEKHAVAPTRYSCRAEFGLVRADKLEAPPEE